MQQLLFYVITILMTFPIKSGQAQEPADIRFADFLERMPKPLPTLTETMTAYGSYDRMDNEMKYANKEIEGNLTVLYTPLLELFNKRLAGNKAQLAVLSKEERDLVEGFRMGTIGISESTKPAVFTLLMGHRPLINSGNLSWTRVSPSASPLVQKLYQQLKDIEAQMDWASYAKKAESYKPKFVESDNENIKAIQIKFDEDFKKLPKKKVKIMEGFYDNVEDPEKAIALLEKHKIDWHQAFEQRYAIRYKWWTKQFEKLSDMSNRLDEIASKAGSHVTNEADRTILLTITDLQGRVWEAWQQLVAVTQGLFMDAMIDATATKQVESSIEIYQNYKKSIE